MFSRMFLYFSFIFYIIFYSSTRSSSSSSSKYIFLLLLLTTTTTTAALRLGMSSRQSQMGAKIYTSWLGWPAGKRTALAGEDWTRRGSSSSSMKNGVFGVIMLKTIVKIRVFTTTTTITTTTTTTTKNKGFY